MGELTAKKFFYKPRLAARGQTEKELFDTGLDQVDARLGKEIWIGDPDYATFSEALAKIGSDNALLNLPAGNYSITTSTTVGSNITLMLHPGAVFQISNNATLTINGPVLALDIIPQFNIDSGSTVDIRGSYILFSATYNVGSGTFSCTSASSVCISGGNLGTQTIIGIAGENLGAYDLCYISSDGKYRKANATSAATMPGIAMPSASITADDSGVFLRWGTITNSSWSFAKGGLIYASTTPGAMTQTPPSGSGKQVQIVGIAISETKIDFDPQLVLVEVA